MRITNPEMRGSGAPGGHLRIRIRPKSPTLIAKVGVASSSLVSRSSRLPCLSSRRPCGRPRRRALSAGRRLLTTSGSRFTPGMRCYPFPQLPLRTCIGGRSPTARRADPGMARIRRRAGSEMRWRPAAFLWVAVPVASLVACGVSPASSSASPTQVRTASPASTEQPTPATATAASTPATTAASTTLTTAQVTAVATALFPTTASGPYTREPCDELGLNSCPFTSRLLAQVTALQSASAWPPEGEEDPVSRLQTGLGDIVAVTVNSLTGSSASVTVAFGPAAEGPLYKLSVIASGGEVLVDDIAIDYPLNCGTVGWLDIYTADYTTTVC